MDIVKDKKKLSGAALSTTAAIGVGTYLNSRWALSTDIKQLMQDRAVVKRLGARIQQLGNEATIYRMLELADQNAEALWFEGITWTYAEAKDEVNRLARFLYSRGVRAGDFVGIYMTNSPEMFFSIYALSRLGAIPALINASLRTDTLKHCITIASASLVLATPDLAEFAVDVSSKVLSLNLGSYTPADPSIEEITQASLLTLSGTPPRPKRSIKDIAALVYTSGTTGKPKAVSIKNFLFCYTSTPLSIDVENAKRYLPLRTYSCLPLFHATALLNGLCYSVGTSGTFCIAKKFSASRFSRELVESRATRMQYVGELCRYLVAAEVSPYDKAHSCIVANGNGLQKDIWEKFQQRFNIPEIREVYRSTEGIAKFDNFKSGPESVGKVGFSGLLRRTLEADVFLVKYDSAKEDLYRDPKTGFCVPAALNEPGEAIGRIRSMELYSEYLNDPQATNKKLARDVFQKGDLFQRSGDLLVQDSNGWVRFHDRTGDTFRWKGENISAGEVRAYISEMENVSDVSVYGVKLDGYDGQMGAAGVTLALDIPEAESKFVSELFKFCKARGLPNYALPRLVRLTKEIDVNASFKHSKEVLKKRSWNPEQNVDNDKLYWLDGETYKPLDTQSWLKITSVKARL